MNEATTNIRYRAYERLTLVLERMEPERLVAELDLNALSVQQMLGAILQKLRAEVDYNLSQQIYVSDELWDEILLARDQMAAFATSIAQRIPADSTALQYAQAMAKAYHNNGPTPKDRALETLKKEVRELF